MDLISKLQRGAAKGRSVLLKPAAAQAVSEVSKKSHPAHPTFLFLFGFLFGRRVRL